MSSLVLIKPDAAKLKLVGSILSWFEFWPIFEIDLRQMDRHLCAAHYADHVNKDFYPALEQAMLSRPTLALAVMGRVEDVRATAMRIREYHKMHVWGPHNLVHASDSEEASQRELRLWFPGSILCL